MSTVVTGTVRAPAGLPVLVATDGSATRRPIQRVWHTGFGWITTGGAWGVGYCPQPRDLAGRDVATVAELRAVWHAVRDVLPVRRVTVLLDSRVAVAYLADWAAGGRRMPPGYLGSARRQPMVHRLADLIATHPDRLRTVWVRGHTGHLLNEAADSLARLGRRWWTEDLPPVTVTARAVWIASGFLADRSLSHQLTEAS